MTTPLIFQKYFFRRLNDIKRTIQSKYGKNVEKMENKTKHQHFVLRDKYLCPHHFIDKPSITMDVFVYRDAHQFCTFRRFCRESHIHYTCIPEATGLLEFSAVSFSENCISKSHVDFVQKLARQ